MRSRAPFLGGVQHLRLLVRRMLSHPIHLTETRKPAGYPTGSSFNAHKTRENMFWDREGFEPPSCRNAAPQADLEPVLTVTSGIASAFPELIRIEAQLRPLPARSRRLSLFRSTGFQSAIVPPVTAQNQTTVPKGSIQ